jgi:hypothetical protein
MTDWDLATALTRAIELEQMARVHWDATRDGPEREATRSVLREAVSLKKLLERLITTRVVRAQLSKTG